MSNFVSIPPDFSVIFHSFLMFSLKFVIIEKKKIIYISNNQVKFICLRINLIEILVF